MGRITLLLAAAIGTAALLASFYPSMINAADVATRVEGENFDDKPPGTKVVTDTTLYSPPNGQALKFTDNTAIAIERAVNFDSQGDVVLWARGGQSGDSPTLSVSVDGGVFSPAQAISNNKAPVAYTYDLNVPAGSHTIGVKAGNTATSRYPFLDFVTFPASGSGGTDPGGDRDADGILDASDNCPDIYNPGQRDDDGDGVGNKCDTGSTPPTDTDSDGVPDSSDNCPNVANANQADSDGDGIGDACETQTSGSAVLVGAGDISSGGSRDQETGDLVRAELSGGAWGVFTTGDNAYPDGTYENHQVYNAAWGSFKDKTRPAFGNHDYFGSSSAQGANQYWNESPAVPVPGGFTNSNSYYSYDIPNTNWRGIVLNSASTEGPTSNQAPSCEAGSPQMDFLDNALNTAKNTVLFWHHARFSASTDHPTSEGATGCSKTFFDVAYDKRADLVVQGHSHLYERYETRDKTGTKVAGGLTSIVCGLGGNSSDGLQGSPSPAYDNAFTNAWGVCKLTLNTNNAQVDFLHAPNSPGADSATVAVRP